MEAVAGDVTEAAGKLAVEPRKVCMGGVFYQVQPVPSGDMAQPVHVHHLAVEVHRQDGLGPFSDGSLNPVNIKKQVFLVNIRKYRSGPGVADG